MSVAEADLNSEARMTKRGDNDREKIRASLRNMLDTATGQWAGAFAELLVQSRKRF